MGVKITLRSRKNKDGTQPLILQVWKNGKAATSHLGYNVKAQDWDDKAQKVKSSHPNSARLNSFLMKKKAEATDTTLDLEKQDSHVSAKAVMVKIKPPVGETFFPQAADYLEDLRAGGKYNQYTADKPRIGHFKDYLKGGDIAFADITPGLLEKFQVYLRSIHTLPKKTASTKEPQRKRPSQAKPRKPLSERTVVNHLVVIRSVFAHARRNKVIPKGVTPFGGDDGIKIVFPETNKIGISPADVESLENLQLEDPRHEHARKIWLFSFYFAGMRISDVYRLRWSDFQNDRLYYTMGKNDKADSLKIPDKAAKILKSYEPYKTGDDDFVFPELKGVDLSNEFNVQRTIAFKASALAETLRLHVAPAAGVSAKVTPHITRHTFAGLAGDAIPVQMLQKLYRHSKVETTIGYQQNFITKPADDALDAVLNKVDTSLSKPKGTK